LQPKNHAVLEGAIVMARETGAEAVLLAAALPEEAAYLRRALGSRLRVITTAINGESQTVHDGDVLALPEIKLRRRGRAKIALLEGLAAGLLHQDERVIVVSGDASDGECELDTVAIVELRTDEDYLDAQAGASLDALSRVSDPAVFDAILGLCVELGHLGREGRAVGLLITLGDHDAVLRHSHPIVLNPFEGHPEAERSVLNPTARRAIREFSGIDGAFVVRSDGIVEAAGRYLQPLAPATDIPSGLGARHRAAAGITAATRCVAFVVAQSSGDTRVFGGGRILMTIEATD
jgi:DNA integrity scanning protein DisA with diadenylate cyclase activity